MNIKNIIFALFVCISYGIAQEAREGNVFTRIDPPSIYQERTKLGKSATVIFKVTYTEEVDSLMSFPGNVYPAVEKALDIWKYLLNSFQTINVKAVWKNVNDMKILAYASPTDYKMNFSNAPKQNVEYPIALAEKLANTYFNNDTIPDIIVTINAKRHADFYYGTDGNTPAYKYDLVTVLLHEMCHGLGFVGTFVDSGGKGYIRAKYENGRFNPNSYDVLLQKDSLAGQNNLVSTYDTASTNLGNALVSDTVFLFGPESHLMGNGLARIYSPNPWEGGSSISHLDDINYPPSNSNSLMVPGLYWAEAIHSPGEVGLAILQDIGWDVNRVITITSPQKGEVVVTGGNHTINWTDNHGGSDNIVLLKDNDAGQYVPYVTLDSNKTSNKGSNSYVWSVASNLPSNKFYKIQIGTSAVSNPFLINNSPVAPPIITPQNGTYAVPLTVHWSAPTDESIYYCYTFDNSAPDTAVATWANNPSSLIASFSGYNLRMKFFAKKNGVKSAVVEVNYTLVPNVHVYQADSSGISFGNWSRWETDQWKSYPDTTFI